MAPILSGTPRRRDTRAPAPSEPASFWRLFAGTGLALAAIGWFDLLLLWIPLNFGSPQWEFGTVSATLDGMPLGTMGLVLLAMGCLGAGWRRRARTLALLCALVPVVLLAIVTIWLLDVPLALNASVGPSRAVMLKSIVKTGVFAFVYVTLYAWLAWTLWRASRAAAAPEPAAP